MKNKKEIVKIKNQDYLLNIGVLKECFKIIKNIDFSKNDNTISEKFIIYYSLYNQIINILASYLCEGEHNHMYIKNNIDLSNDPITDELIESVSKNKLVKIRNNISAHPLLVGNKHELNLPDLDLIEFWISKLDLLIHKHIHEDIKNIDWYTFGDV